MTALQTPAPDAPAEEWGQLAVLIPDWRWPRGGWLLPGFFRGAPDGDWQRVKDVGACGWPDGERVPDPDHWAWWGWLITMIGPERVAIAMWVDHITVGQSHLVMDTSALGRACIAAAAANGRWPGGEL